MPILGMNEAAPTCRDFFALTFTLTIRRGGSIKYCSLCASKQLPWHNGRATA
jgi:hypothetical protein